MHPSRVVVAAEVVHGEADHLVGREYAFPCPGQQGDSFVPLAGGLDEIRDGIFDAGSGIGVSLLHGFPLESLAARDAVIEQAVTARSVPPEFVRRQGALALVAILVRYRREHRSRKKVSTARRECVTREAKLQQSPLQCDFEPGEVAVEVRSQFGERGEFAWLVSHILHDFTELGHTFTVAFTRSCTP